MIPLDAPSLMGNEKKYLIECIDTNWISWQGEFISRLEKGIADYCGTKYAVAVINGTYGLIMALRAMNIGKGDEVIVPAFTMSASAFAVESVGAKVVWVDTKQGCLTLDPADVEDKITIRTKAVMAVHLYGYTADMCSLRGICDSFHIPIIEDAAESFGAIAGGKKVGSLGKIACHSFHNKIIGSGEGGAITTDDPDLYEKLLLLRLPPPDNAGGTLMTLNNRMSNLTAAVALAQLERVDEIIDLRRNRAKIYTDYLSEIEGIDLIKERSDERAVYWRYQILLDPQIISNKNMVLELKGYGIESRTVFRLMPYHEYYNMKDLRFPRSEHISAVGVDIPSGPSLTEADAGHVCEAIRKILDKRR